MAVPFVLPALAADGCASTPNWQHGEDPDGNPDTHHNAYFKNLLTIPPDGGIVRPVDPFTVTPGSFIKVDLMVCTDLQETSDEGKMVFTTKDQDNPPGTNGENPVWFGHDRLKLDQNSPTRVTTVFQAVPNVPGLRFTMKPILKHGTTGGANDDGISIENPDNELHFLVQPATQVEQGTPPPHTPGPPTTPCPPASSDPDDPVPMVAAQITHVTLNNAGSTPIENHTAVHPDVVIVASIRAACPNGAVPPRTIRQAVKFLAFPSTSVCQPGQDPGTCNVETGLCPPDPCLPTPDALSQLFLTVPWEDAPFNKDTLTGDFADSAQTTVTYQTVPRLWGTYVLIPRVIGDYMPEGDTGPTPDSKVLAEGEPFVFCVGPNDLPPPDNPECTYPPPVLPSPGP